MATKSRTVQAIEDALATARVQLDTERRAVALCRVHLFDSDLKFALREFARLEALIIRLEARKQRALESTR